MEKEKIVQKPLLGLLLLSVFGYSKQGGVGWAQSKS